MSRIGISDEYVGAAERHEDLCALNATEFRGEWPEMNNPSKPAQIKFARLEKERLEEIEERREKLGSVLGQFMDASGK